MKNDLPILHHFKIQYFFPSILHPNYEDIEIKLYLTKWLIDDSYTFCKGKH